ncbi:MAG: LemA family protein [archaeon]|nr:LemA family protein [archaeon]
MIGILISLGILILIVVMFISYFNRFAILENRIENSFSQIDVQLKKRSDLIPNLLESVKGYMKHEKAIITEVTNARKALVGAKGVGNKLKADKGLESALGRLFAIAENYPNLKASENFGKLQEELSAIEDKVAYARQYYNDSVLDYDNLFSTFPGNMFAKMFSKKQKEYLKITESERKVPKVSF